MKKNDLFSAVAEQTGITRKLAAEIVDAVFDQMTEALADGDTVHIKNFGSFEIRERKARTARNPKTGEPVQAKATKSVGFKALKGLKEKINQ